MHHFFVALAVAAALVLVILGVVAMWHVVALLFETVARRGWQWADIYIATLFCSVMALIVAMVGAAATEK